MRARPEFPTPEMQAIERELDARIDVGLAQAREVRDTLDRLAAQEEKSEPESDGAGPDGDGPAMLPDGAALQGLVTGHAMTPQWRDVVERIDRGTLTWDGVLADLRAGRADPQVTAAFQSFADVPPPGTEDLVALGLLPDPDAADVSDRPRR